jgi:hypothetical protein
MSATGLAGAAGAAGASGTAGVAGAAGATSAGGSGGAAGSSGGAGAAGVAGSSGGGAGAPGACNALASYGTPSFTAVNQTAVESYAAAFTVIEKNLVWQGFLSTTAQPDALTITFNPNKAPFGSPITPPSAPIDLSTQNQTSTCGACVVLYTQLGSNSLPSASTQTYLATGGTLSLSVAPAVPPSSSSSVSATLSNVTFEHVTVDGQSGVSTPAPDGCTTTLTSALIDSPVVGQTN